MSRHWSEPLDGYTQGLSVVDVPREVVDCLSSDVIDSIRQIHAGQEDKHMSAARFLTNVQRVLLRDDAHVTVCAHNQPDGVPEKCCNVADVCSLLLRELRSRNLSALNGISLVMKPWLDIGGGSEFQVFVQDSTIKAIFQRKTDRDRMTIDQRKQHLFILKDFLRSMVLQIAQDQPYMMNLFIDGSNRIWALNAASEGKLHRPSPAQWVEMPSSRPSSGVFSRPTSSSSQGSASGSSSPAYFSAGSAPFSTMAMASSLSPTPSGVLTSPQPGYPARQPVSPHSPAQPPSHHPPSPTHRTFTAAASAAVPVPAPVAAVPANTEANQPAQIAFFPTQPLPSVPAPLTHQTGIGARQLTIVPVSPGGGARANGTSPGPLSSTSNSIQNSNQHFPVAAGATAMTTTEGTTTSAGDSSGNGPGSSGNGAGSSGYVSSAETSAATVSAGLSTSTATVSAPPSVRAYIASPLGAASPPKNTLFHNPDVDSPKVELNDDYSHPLPDYLSQRYDLGPVLGKGGYAFVREGIDKTTNTKIAMKIVNRAQLKPSAEAAIKREVYLLNSLNHPNIVRTYAFYEESDCFYTVLECINGGALFDRLKYRTVFTEAQVRELARVLLSAILHCHERNIVHRDLKPENLIMTSDDNNADLKVVDFGFAAIDTGGCTLTDRCGTPMYVAPEILQKIPHGKPVDLWSFGVILFLLLSGDAPFKDPNVKALYTKIKNGVFYFKSQSWKDISPTAMDLVKGLLEISQLKRLTVQQALAHPWFSIPEEELSSKHLSTTIECLRSFQAAQRFRKGVNAVRALNRMKFKHSMTRSEYIDQMNRWPMDVEARYELGDILGKGGYATVCAGISKLDKREVAIKTIPLAGLKPSTEAGIRREAEILRHLHHKNIVKSYDFIDTTTHLHVVLERVDGGELFDRIIKKKCYNEKEARDLAVVILKAIKHCHDHKVVHRDLKPENLLMTGRDDSSADLKLVDFGFAAKVEGFSLINQCGTPAYVAPEIIRKQPHGLPVDMWSFGVILYILLCGYPPFRDKVEKQLFIKIRSGVYEFHPKYWDKVSEEAKDLIRRLLVINPVERYTVDETLSHPWIHADPRQLSSYDLSESLSELELFQNSRRFKVGINVIKAIHRMSKSRFFDESASESNTAANSVVSSPNPHHPGIAAVGTSPLASAGLSTAATAGDSPGGDALPSPAGAKRAAANKRMAGLLLQAAAKVALEGESNSADAQPNNVLFRPEPSTATATAPSSLQEPHAPPQLSPQAPGPAGRIPVFSPDSRKTVDQSTYFSPRAHVVDTSALLPTPPRGGSLTTSIQKQRVLLQGNAVPQSEGAGGHSSGGNGSVLAQGLTPPSPSRPPVAPSHSNSPQQYVAPSHPHSSPTTQYGETATTPGQASPPGMLILSPAASAGAASIPTAIPIAPFSPKSAALSAALHSPHGNLNNSWGSASSDDADGHKRQQAQLVDLMHSLHMENNSVDCI